MNAHSGARNCPATRGLLVRRILDQGWSVELAAAEADARSLGARGMAAWGLWLPFWMKASWFRRLG